MSNLFTDLSFLIQRLTLASIFDIIIVTAIFYVLLKVVREPQGTVLLRGVIFIVILFTLLTSLVNLPAFSWLISTALPALLFAIPVIFAPEIRRALERLGRAASSSTLQLRKSNSMEQAMQPTISSVVTAAARLSGRRHGALIVLQRANNLQEYIDTGVVLNSEVSPQLLLQIFYPNTPLHDGAVIIQDNTLAAASCVMPLSASGIVNRSPERNMGLRHRASLGISESSDAITVVVSEETGSISIAYDGHMSRSIKPSNLARTLNDFFRPTKIPSNLLSILKQFFSLSETAESGED